MAAGLMDAVRSFGAIIALNMDVTIFLYQEVTFICTVCLLLLRYYRSFQRQPRILLVVRLQNAVDVGEGAAAEILAVHGISMRSSKGCGLAIPFQRPVCPGARLLESSANLSSVNQSIKQCRSDSGK